MIETPGTDASFRVQGGAAWRDLSIHDGILSTTAIGIGERARFDLASTELALVLDTATWRRDIAIWRWSTAAEAVGEEFAAPDLDDSGWRIVPHLHPLFDTTTATASWFRTELMIDENAGDESISIVIGGFDDEDWTTYVAYLDGAPLHAWEGRGRLREPRRIVIDGTDPRHAALRAGGRHVLAVRAHGLERSSWRTQPGEREHYFFQGWLLDQYVAGGEPTRRLDDFVVEGFVREPGDDHIVIVRSSSMPDLSAELRFSGAADGIRKRIIVRNEGRTPVAVLDVVGEEWRGGFDTAGGGRGQPIHLGDIGFTGIEHPAGVNLCDTGHVQLVQMPGVTIPGGGEWSARPIILGGSDDRSTDAAFRDYIRGLRRRPTSRLRVYSPLGWYDFTNPADPLPELTAELVAENLQQLRELRDAGADFDVYMIDDWWEPTDLAHFRTRTFPTGATPIGRAIREAGMEPGLWWATTRALWTASEAPGVERSFANDPQFGGPVVVAGTWRWVERFGNSFNGERRLCLAAEPYRSMFQTAIPRLVEELDVALLKLDCATLHCTSSDHDHRPGRHSVEPMIDALQTLIERCTAVRPDLRIVWYWGFRSPWFLGLGDMMFDKGLLMEAVTPSSAPLPTSRQSMSLNVDQSIEHAATLPLELQDSLGVWIGDVGWCNRVGREEWREAYLLDASRGSDLVQLWGDLTLLDAGDQAFLAAVQGWVQRLGRAGSATLRVGGSAWQQEPYGYVRPADGGVLLTLVNPSWTAARYEVDRRLPGFPAGPWRAIELYPYPGLVESADPLDLAPMEVRMIHIVPVGHMPRDIGATQRPLVRDARPIDTQALALPGGERPASVSADLVLPTLERGDAIYVSHRLSRDGAWACEPEPQAQVSFEATLDGLNVRFDTIPRHRDRNGPGSSWVLRRIPAGPAWSGRRLRVTVSTDLPGDVDVTTEARVLDEWWARVPRAFADLTRPPT